MIVIYHQYKHFICFINLQSSFPICVCVMLCLLLLLCIYFHFFLTFIDHHRFVCHFSSFYGQSQCVQSSPNGTKLIRIYIYFLIARKFNRFRPTVYGSITFYIRGLTLLYSTQFNLQSLFNSHRKLCFDCSRLVFDR